MDVSTVVENILNRPDAKTEISHISEKPWSEYTKADYTIEQWHAACLIHLHSGPPTSKSQCKLPVKTPSGALNRNGVHAAAAALAGARTPLQAPAEQKAKAAASLRGYYRQLGEQPPPSLMKHSSLETLEDVLEHFGVKGMRWGVRRKATVGPQEVFVRPSKFPGSRRLVAKGGKGHPAMESAIRARKIGQVGKKSGLHSLTDQELQEYARRIQLEQNVQRLQYTQLNPGQRFVANLLRKTGEGASDPANIQKAARTKAGKKAIGYTIRKSGRVGAKAAAVAALA